ncbi:DUF7402 domain-containing protein [Paenibacillus terrigena]|uniref:DUF7402 domain-containing protein n=1 Tax=Paenibacillus terrigena TaxID=369333 RepID=UPI00036BA46F|nr:glycosyl hydrolase-related protein [Paenibacillus terrigena]
MKLFKVQKALSLVLCLCMVISFFTPLTKVSAAVGDVTISKVKQTSMVRTDGKQETMVSVSNGSTAFSGWAKVTIGTNQPYTVAIGKIAAGTSDVMVPVSDTHAMLKPGETTTLKLELCDNEQCSGSAKAVYQTDEWARTRHWEFYLSQQMHTDLGYTLYQEDLKKAYSSYLDMAIQYVKESDKRGTDIEKYKYAVESSYMMGEAYSKNRNADQIQEIKDFIDVGRMTIGAGQFNYTTENFSTEEAARAPYYTNRHMVDKLGVDPSTTQRMFDNPSFSKGYVDAAVQAGIKYGIHSMNGDRSPYYKKRQYDLFYLEGMDPNNKMLIFNGKSYAENYGFGGTHGSDAGSVASAQNSIMSIIGDLESRVGRNAYPYDKFPMPLVPFGDNRQPSDSQIKVANDLNKQWKDAGYAYPRVKSAFAEEFFEDVEAEYKDMIPVETGTEENWWNDGWGTTAYESGTNKEAGSLIPVAETMASFASTLTGSEYPYDDLFQALERNHIYDEHTWGAAGYGSADYHNQFEWKRSNAFGAKLLARKVLDNSLKQLASRVGTTGKGIYVYNQLNWVRNDVVAISDLSDLPAYFVIKDGSKSVPYTIKDGVLTFVAKDVPALGYKTYTIEETQAVQSYTPQVITGDNFIENDYYKVTFAPDGTISSIVDKQNGNQEIVDAQAPVKFNQYQYYDDFGIPFSNMGASFDQSKWKLYVPGNPSKLDVQANGYSAAASMNTATFRTNSIKQKVTLYNDIPRIDILNEIVKEPLPNLQAKEEAFYTFPFKTSGSNYEIRYDLPIGNTIEGDQVYGTSHDWYTANKWVNVKDKSNNYNMTLALPNSALLQFGERRTGNWSFDYKSEKPYIYSYIMNNMWQTNFQGDQPGYVNFKYCISTNTDVGVGESARFGWEISTPLQATVITGQQGASGPVSDSIIKVNKDNIQLTTMKASEANSDGMIVRFHEITGKATNKVTVTLPFDNATVTETDIVENDLSEVSNSSTFTFDIPAYGIKTFRVRYGSAPEAVTNLNAVSNSIKAINLSKNAIAMASSEYSAQYAAENAKDIGNGLEWASKGQKEAWYQLTWSSPVTVKKILVADRPNSTDDISSAIITFSDNSTVEITDIPPNGKPKVIVLPEEKTITSLKIDIKGTPSTLNVGLIGLEVYASDLNTNAAGTQLSWDAVDRALYYEIFRDTKQDFTAGRGNYLETTRDTVWFDTQVTVGLKDSYYYKVRAAAAGANGKPSAAVSPHAGDIVDTTVPGTPNLVAQPRGTNQIDLFWTPVHDNVMVDYYEVYRDGVKLGGMYDNYVCSYRDRTAKPGVEYTYTVKAVDTSGNVAESNAVKTNAFTNGVTLSDLEVSMGTLSPKFDSALSVYSLNMGDNFGRFEGVKVTPTTDDADAVITVNGIEVANGKETLIPIKEEGDKITIEVKKDGQTKFYFLTVTANDPIIVPNQASVGSEWAPQSGGQKAANLINNSGMSGTTSLQDTHDTASNTIWHTDSNPGNKAWAKIDLGKVYQLDEMWIWNINQANNSSRGLKNVKIEYSIDDIHWSELNPPKGMVFKDVVVDGYPFQLATANGKTSSKATNLNNDKNSPVSFEGKDVRYVRITAHPEPGVGSWGDIYYGLSELRFTRAMELIDFIPVEEIVVSAQDNAHEITVSGGSLQMTANVEPKTATKNKVQWSVTDEAGNETKDAIIDKNGMLFARSNGTVKVIATASDGTRVTGEYTVQITGQKELLPVAKVTAGSTYSNLQPPINIINSSGMSGTKSLYDIHDNNGNAATMWHTDINPGVNAWIEFDLEEVSSVGEMWIWNINQQNNIDRGFKDVKIEYKVNEEDQWTELRGSGSKEGKAYPYTFARATGNPNQPATNLVGGKSVVFNTQARFIKLTADPVAGQGSYGDVYYGLSEVRFTRGEAVEKTAAAIGGPENVRAGESFDLTYGLNNVTDSVYAQHVKVSYDPDKVEFVSAESIADGVAIVKQKAEPGQIQILVASLGEGIALSAGGDVLKLHWKAKPLSSSALSAISFNAVIANGNGLETQLDSAAHQVQILAAAVDKSALNALISDAQSAHDNATEGVHIGQYPAGSKAVLQAAIDTALAVSLNNSATQQQVNQATIELGEALHAFRTSVITSKTGDVNGDGKVTVGDLGIIARYYGTKNTDPNWDIAKVADVNNDGKIDIVDLAIVARRVLDTD